MTSRHQKKVNAEGPRKREKLQQEWKKGYIVEANSTVARRKKKNRSGCYGLGYIYTRKEN